MFLSRSNDIQGRKQFVWLTVLNKHVTSPREWKGAQVMAITKNADETLGESRKQNNSEQERQELLAPVFPRDWRWILCSGLDGIRRA